MSVFVGDVGPDGEQLRARPPRIMRDDDRPREDGSDRYAIYTVSGPIRRRLAETSREGIGACLVTLRDEGGIGNDSRVGVLDREARRWIVNPWAKGTPPA